MVYQRASEGHSLGSAGDYQRASNIDASRLARYRKLMASGQANEMANDSETETAMPQAQIALKSAQPTSAYQSATLSVTQQRRLQQQRAQEQHRQWERQEQERMARHAERERQQQAQEKKARAFLKQIKTQDPLEPDRRWFEDYAKHCTSDLEAAMDLIGIMK